MVIGGLCWFVFALAFGFLLWQYISQGAGLQFFGILFTSGSVLMGLVHVVGLVIAITLCFVHWSGFVRLRTYSGSRDRT